MAGCADAGKDQSVTAGQEVTLDASASRADFHGQIKKYRWKQVQGTSVTLSNKRAIRPTFTAPSLTQEEVLVFSLKTVEHGGIVSPWRTRDRVRITVSPSSSQAPTAVATASASTLKYGDAVSFSAASSSDSDGQIVSYEWKDANGTVLSTQETFTHTFATTGTHTLTLTVTDNDAQSATATVSVTVNELQAPIAHINASATQITVNSTVSFDANGSSDADGEIVSYTWLDESNTTVSNLSAFTHTFSTSGVHTITLKVMDDDSQETSTSVDIVVEAVLDSLTLSATTQSLDINESTSLTATAHYSDASTEDVSTSVVWSVQDSSIATVDANGTLTALQAGSTTVSASIGPVSSSALSITVNPPVVVTSIAVNPNPVEIRVGSSLQLDVTATYSDQSTESVDVADYTVDDANIITIDPTGTLDALAVGSTSFRVKVGSVYSGLVFVTVGEELNTTNFNFTNFGNTYTSLIPIDATQTQYDEKRFCMIAGQIKAKDASPLSGVRVSIHGHPEYGTVLTDANGSYAIPAEGGLNLTMRYRKQGYTTIDRKVLAPVQDWVRTPDVTMLAVDPKVTQVTLGTATPQMHVSTKVTDDRGSRSTTLVFDGVSRATVTAPDGTTRILTDIAVRATEFETPTSMPSDLPKESAFTYCSDLSIDGVGDDENVTFDAPVVMYVDNFLGFDIGEIVPVGYYDRNAGEWKASDNGVVVKLLDTDGDGVIDALDANGSDTPNDLDGDGDYADEVAGLANNPEYIAGKTYWRAEIMHFTPWDHNWPWGPPLDAEDPEAPNDIKVDYGDTPDKCIVPISSYVQPKAGVFHEDIAIAGTNITLHYSSKRTKSFKYTISASVDTSTVPSSAIGVVVELDIAGKRYSSFSSSASFAWDGRDAKGSAMVGKVSARVRVGFRYNLVYYASIPTWQYAWARIGGTPTSIQAQNITLWSNYKTIEIYSEASGMDTGINGSTNVVANGWSISNHHKAFRDILLRGDGSIEKKEEVFLENLEVFAGNGNKYGGSTGDGGLAINAGLDFPRDMAIDSDGNLYIAEGNHIRKVDKNGIITTVVETPEKITNIAVDGQMNIYYNVPPGRCYRLNLENGKIDTFIKYYEDTDDTAVVKNLFEYGWGVKALFVDKFANKLYITLHNETYEIDLNSNIAKKIAGVLYSENGFSGDGGLATEAMFSNIREIASDGNGNIYIADSGNNRIRKINTAGIINTIAGNGAGRCDDYEREEDGGCPSISSGSALDVALLMPRAIAIDASNMLYIADTDNGRIYIMDDKGYEIRRIRSNIYVYNLLFNQQGDLLMADPYNGRIMIQRNLFLFSHGTHKNKNNTADIFSITGKHLKTIDLNTGNTLKTFTYDANSHLVSITDQFDNVTTITRDANGNPTQITAPNGQVTTLNVDENGNLVEVGYEDNSKYTFSYYDGSLMDTMTDPNGNVIKHKYNDIGRIVEEIDGLGGSYQFLRNVSGGETFYSTVLPEGETSTSKDVHLANGDTQSLMTLPTGETLTATFAKDERKTTSLRDGVSSVTTYTTDTLTHQRILASRETTQPSGLKSTTTYATVYDGNETHTNSKTQTITQNTKATTMVTDYNAGTSTLTTSTGRSATRTYDVDTLLTQETKTGTLTPTTYIYDSKGRVTKERTGTRETSYTYDSRGNVASITDPRGQSTTYSYDIVDNLTQVNYPNGTTEHFSYDKNGNLLTRTVPTPAEHRFSYNGGDLRTNYTSPLNKSTTYSYDRSKNITSIVKPSGKTITNTYNNGRLESTQTPEGTTSYSYLFASKIGNITQGSESFTYTYDGTLLTKTEQAGVLNHTTNFTYNNDFLVTSSTYAGETESYAYDDDGLLTQSGDYTLTRDPQNAYVTNLTDGTLTQSRSYNSFGEITEVSDNTFTYELPSRDQSGAIVQKKETINGTTVTYDYTYDNMGRLTQVQKNNTITETYTYDNNGNRASATVNGTSITASYTLDDNLVVYGDNSYLYDDDGYLKTKTTPSGTTTYSYGTRGELLAVTTPTKTITYKHNALNQRVAKLINGQVVEKYLWANLTTLLAVYDSSDNLLQRFEYADQRMPVAMTKGADKFYLHYDQVGSLRAVTDSSHNIVKEISYDTFGNILSDSNEAFTIPFGFAGGLHDADTKLTRFGYRDYDAYMGKWTAKDPIGFDGGDSNLYGYVLGDPVGLVDSSG